MLLLGDKGVEPILIELTGILISKGTLPFKVDSLV